MNVMSVGRVCFKTKGRTAGERVVIVGKGEKNNVIIKEGKTLSECNIRHLFPTKETEKVEEVKLSDLRKMKEIRKEKHAEKLVKLKEKAKEEKEKANKSIKKEERKKEKSDAK